jgi:hypothetical protein
LFQSVLDERGQIARVISIALRHFRHLKPVQDGIREIPKSGKVAKK